VEPTQDPTPAKPLFVGDGRVDTLVMNDIQEKLKDFLKTDELAEWNFKKLPQPAVPSCIYDRCQMVYIEGASQSQVNGYYFPTYPLCKDNVDGTYGQDYGKELLGARWDGFTNHRSGATISWLWDETPQRGWGIDHGGRRLYFDRRNCQRGRQMFPENIATAQTSDVDNHGRPEITCLPMRKDIHPLMAAGAEMFVQFLGSYNYDMMTYYDLADSAPFVLSGPITIMFSASWRSLRNWGRIIDFGAGEADNNIIVGNCAETTSLCFSVYVDSKEFHVEVKHAIEVGKMRTWLLTLTADGAMKVWRDGTLLAEKHGAPQLRAVARPHLFVGRSIPAVLPAKTNDGFFDGAIEDIRVWRGGCYGWGASNFIPSPSAPGLQGAKEPLAFPASVDG